MQGQVTMSHTAHAEGAGKTVRNWRHGALRRSRFNGGVSQGQAHKSSPSSTPCIALCSCLTLLGTYRYLVEPGAEDFGRIPSATTATRPPSGDTGGEHLNTASRWTTQTLQGSDASRGNNANKHQTEQQKEGDSVTQSGQSQGE